MRVLSLALNPFKPNTAVHIELDGNNKLEYTKTSQVDTLYFLNQNGNWQVTGKPDVLQKARIIMEPLRKHLITKCFLFMAPAEQKRKPKPITIKENSMLKVGTTVAMDRLML